ncbi:hypothetical protein EVAR_93578_1 [Eumeta japonica]|uniref:Uncharacterized protein n=1 Tax=Eumeta variegata TaxID=151549 RepID=A0A4C1UR34_EUMVA|nr:hypothetical protein EVAR_93578_1 [Eumeta japonica]
MESLSRSHSDAHSQPSAAKSRKWKPKISFQDVVQASPRGSEIKLIPLQQHFDPRDLRAVFSYLLSRPMRRYVRAMPWPTWLQHKNVQARPVTRHTVTEYGRDVASSDVAFRPVSEISVAHSLLFLPDPPPLDILFPSHEARNFTILG